MSSLTINFPACYYNIWHKTNNIQLSCFWSFEPYIVLNTTINLWWFSKTSNRTYLLCTRKISIRSPKENYQLDESSFCHIHCLDKLDVGILQAEICILEVHHNSSENNYTFLFSHRHSDFHVFDELISLLFHTTHTSWHTFSYLNLHYHAVLINHLFTVYF